MATRDVKVPSVGESITSGILAKWHVKEGEVVKVGQLLYDLETDKITSEGHAEVGGVVHLKVKEGEEVKIGQVVAGIEEGVEVVSGSTVGDKKEKVEKVMEVVGKNGVNGVKGGGVEKALSPAVRVLAPELGVDPEKVAGSGKGGRVTKGDLLKVAEGRGCCEDTVVMEREEVKEDSEVGERKVTRVKMTPIRRKIAERLVAAKREAAILTTFNEVDMSAVMELRKRHQEAFMGRYGVKLGFMSFFVKAVVKGLMEVPQLNAQVDGEYIVQNHYYDIGVAVGSGKGLVVPVVRGADKLNLAQIEKVIGEYGQKAKEGKITIGDMEGGVFTISNGGVYGSMLSTPIVNPPQSGILGMHNIKDRAVVVDGQVVVRPIMYLALSYDHRIVDGREAVTFLNTVKKGIEEPVSMFLGV